MKLQNLFIAAALLFATTAINAQSLEQRTDSHNVTIGIPNVALLDIESTTSNAISLNATAPTEAGDAVVFNQTNNDLWINYSSIVGTDATREVSVQITDGDVPAGLELSVVAKADAEQGEGTTGSVSGDAIVLNGNSAATIIEGVGSAYTGNGANKGHNLTYKIAQSNDSDSYSKLNFEQSQTLTITYTLSDI